MTDPETDFIDLLTACKESPDKSIEHENLLKVMESGIFYKGGLKGKVLLQTQQGRVIEWQVWPILNLRELLLKLTSVITVETEPEKIVKEFVSGYFDNLLKAFDSAAPLARLGGVRKSSIDKTKKVLLNWKEDTIQKIPTFPKTAPNEIAEILLAHLPSNTPQLTIANRINELMGAFNQEGGKIETLRKMVADKRKK